MISEKGKTSYSIEWYGVNVEFFHLDNLFLKFFFILLVLIE